MAISEVLINRTVGGRIKTIAQAIPILQEHLDKFGSEIQHDAFEFISKNIEYFKRELRIRKDYSIY